MGNCLMMVCECRCMDCNPRPAKKAGFTAFDTVAYHCWDHQSGCHRGCK